MGLTSLLCSLLGTIYPEYASFVAIESAAHDDDKQWLTYWVIHGMLVMAEAWCGWLFKWFPFYYQVKLLVVLWPIAPQTQGAKRLYEEFMRPFLYKNAKNIDPVFRGTQALSQLQGINMAQLSKLVRSDPRMLGRALNMAMEALPSTGTAAASSSQSTGASST